MNRYAQYGLYLALPFLLFSIVAMSSQDAGEKVLKRGQINEDVYAAGGRVEVFAEVDGDVVAAGGRVTIDGKITGDVLAAGGEVILLGHVKDDVRLAGGEVSINATVGDGVVAAGGNVLLAPNASVGGNVMLSGGRVEVAGKVRGNVRIGAGEIIITGQIDGNVELAGKSIIIKPGAVIRGNLTYRSPEIAKIDAQARIEGTISHIKTPIPGAAQIIGVLSGVAVLLWLSISLTGIVLYLLFPQTALSAVRAAATKPWKAMGLGLAIFAATPVLVMMLFSSVIGWLLAWLLITVYAVLLLTGSLTGVLFLSDASMRRIRHRNEASKLGNSIAFALSLLVVMLIGLIPLLGWLLVFLLWLFGVGALALHCYSLRRTSAA